MALLNQTMTLPPPKESNFNLSSKHRTDLYIGMATPVDNIAMIPGDIINLSDRAKMITDALQAPLFGSMRLQIDQFFVPYRILWDKWPDFIMQNEEMRYEVPYYMVISPEIDNHILEPESSVFASYFLPYQSGDNYTGYSIYGGNVDSFRSDYGDLIRSYNKPFINGFQEQDFCTLNWQTEEGNDFNVETFGYSMFSRSPLNIVRPCSLINYLELPVGHVDGLSTSILENFSSRHPMFNVLAYNKIWYEWYRNPQEKTYAFYGQPQASRIGNNSLSINYTSPFYIVYSNEEMENAIDYVNSANYISTAFSNPNTFASGLEVDPSSVDGMRKFLFSLKKRCYKHDYLSSVLNAENYESSTAVVNISNNQFTINQWRQALHVDRYKKRNYLGGDKYIDWIRAQYGVIDSDARLQRPQLLSSTSSEILFVDVESTASTDGATLGQLASRGLTLNQQQDSIKFRATEHGVLMTIASIVPLVDNVDGVSRFAYKCDVFDHFVPALDNIDMQPVHAYEYSTTDGVMKALASDRYLSLTSQFIKDGFSLQVETAKNLWLGYLENRRLYLNMYENENAVGYLPAWTEYKTRMNRVSGYLSTMRQNMVLSRPNPYANDIVSFDAKTGYFEPRYYLESDIQGSFGIDYYYQLTSINSDKFYYPEFNDNWLNNVYISQYVDFRDYAHLWPDTTGKYPTCEVQFAFDITMRRPMSKWSLPI